MNNELWKMDIKITGIDLDIKIINKYETINNKNKKLFIKNFTDNLYSNSDLKNYNKVELFYKKYFEINLVNNYDLIFMNMSIHNIFRDINKINTFIQNIIRFNSGYMFITYIDSSIFSNKSKYSENIIWLSDSSYIKKIKKETVYELNSEKYYIEWIEIYYSWRHKTPIIEPLVNKKLLNKLFNNIYPSVEILNYKENMGYNFSDQYKNICDAWKHIFNHTNFILYSK